MIRFFVSMLFVLPSAFFPSSAFAYNSKAQANAAIMIVSACKWWQMGKIPRNSIMSLAKEGYNEKYGNANNVDWDNALTIAQKLDKQKDIGCIN